jgi:hypothetical protein
MKKAYLDDVRATPDDFTIRWKSYDEALAYMVRYGCPDFISFDHDLGTDKTGMDVCKWIVAVDINNNSFIPKGFMFHVHSSNPQGAMNIFSYLSQYLRMKEFSED